MQFTTSSTHRNSLCHQRSSFLRAGPTVMQEREPRVKRSSARKKIIHHAKVEQLRAMPKVKGGRLLNDERLETD
jgi:hypothetical protein